jgi:alpha-glucosidase
MNLPGYVNSIHHDGSGRYVQPQGPLALGDTVTIQLRAAPAAPIQRVLLRACPDGEQFFIELQPEPEPTPACRWWRGSLPMLMPVMAYRFLIFTEDGIWWYNGSGAQRHAPTDAEDFRLLAGYQAPDWVQTSVFYQIFPDRFADGDPASNVRDGEFVYRDQPATARPWGAPPARGRAAMVEFYGGDLPGITAHLDDLAELGVNALYLNPVFSAYSNHRYDVTDYENVDPHLGGNAALAALRQAADARGLRFILDIVPNHCGMLHPWFQAAQANLQAPSAEFFTFRQHPDDYEAWLGVRSLPKLNYRSQQLRDLMYAGPEAIFRRWLRPPYRADGWRIDVANMLARQGAQQLGHEIGQGIRQAVKAENPAAYLIGENFFDATSQLQGDCWDAVMNYAGFMLPVHHWLTHYAIGQFVEPRRVESATPWPTEALAATWQAHRAAIPWAIARQQYNLLGSHDTARLLTSLGGDLALNCLAVTLLFTYPGVPSVYYGDEIGLGRQPEATARDCMPWERTAWDLELRAFYQRLIQLRRSSPALIDGGFQLLLAEGDTLAYLRDAAEEQIIVVAQRGAATRPGFPLRVADGGLPEGLEFVEVFSGQRRGVAGGCLELPTLVPGAQLWQSQNMV